MRLSDRADALITEEARRTKRSKGAVVEALAEEALRTRLFPGIAFRGEDWDRRPWVIGTSFDVWQVVEASRDFESTAALAAEGTLTEPQIRLALAYAERFPEEIEDAIRLNHASLAALTERYPLINVATDD